VKGFIRLTSKVYLFLYNQNQHTVCRRFGLKSEAFFGSDLWLLTTVYDSLSHSWLSWLSW